MCDIVRHKRSNFATDLKKIFIQVMLPPDDPDDLDEDLIADLVHNDTSLPVSLLSSRSADTHRDASVEQKLALWTKTIKCRVQRKLNEKDGTIELTLTDAEQAEDDRGSSHTQIIHTQLMIY